MKVIQSKLGKALLATIVTRKAKSIAEVYESDSERECLIPIVNILRISNTPAPIAFDNGKPRAAAIILEKGGGSLTALGNVEDLA